MRLCFVALTAMVLIANSANAAEFGYAAVTRRVAQPSYGIAIAPRSGHHCWSEEFRNCRALSSAR